MFNRFGPYTIFNFKRAGKNAIENSFAKMDELSTASKGKYWSCYEKIRDDLKQTVSWVYKNRKIILKSFPRTSAGVFQMNKSILIKEYIGKAKPTPQRLGSIGFEGSNLRLVVASDKNRMLYCKFGEYLNLSGKLLNFKEGFPIVKPCEVCDECQSVFICTICGKSHCEKCTYVCELCENRFCQNCIKSEYTYFTPHVWYFHRKK